MFTGGYEGMLNQARLFDQRYTSARWAPFKAGVGVGARLSTNDVMILNGGATLAHIKPVAGCMFAQIPSMYSEHYWHVGNQVRKRVLVDLSFCGTTISPHPSIVWAKI
jgi:hypothetical protein